MSMNGAVDQRRDHSPANAAVVPAEAPRVRLNPSMEHKPDNYDDLPLEFCPVLFSCLERYLLPSMLTAPRDTKVDHMREILLSYSPEAERIKKLSYLTPAFFLQPLHKELYGMHATNFFVSSFLKAIHENTEESFRSIMSEPVPGIFVFEMLQPEFCRLLLEEVEHFEKWVHDKGFIIMHPNLMSKYGVVLDDFGLETMLDKLMCDFVRPISKVFFSDVGGSTLDSHHGFVVEYGIDKDVNLGFHVDDAEVTLNICLGKQFSGGELFFRGVRITINGPSRYIKQFNVSVNQRDEEIFDYSQVPGQAILHHGRHRHGARATTDGNRINLVLWCRSSVFRELKKYQKDFPSWCGECKREKKARQQISISATKQELLKDGEPLT
ncbi:hypothetical protein Cgig2_010485 [Carnegiea gigantea]|uniref:Fe2OG dioxygenase domain-containing protein n=1 Tax=Carnegiea gigantea TaxID=171969 RepID=A0A9Q1KS62_9CARY|nr:hypothetical protein Cgig2_010485 [Carnegiea gigantea]